MSDESVTKPTLETVLERMTEMRTALTGEITALSESLNGRLDRVESRLDGIEEHLRKIDKRIAVLSEDKVNLRGDIRLMEDRVASESKAR